MKVIMTVLLLLLSHTAYASCEATIREGRHSALTQTDAETGALEEARDACYPGTITRMALQCDTIEGGFLPAGQTAVQCIQTVSCNLCNDNLIRKYEAYD